MFRIKHLAKESKRLPDMLRHRLLGGDVQWRARKHAIWLTPSKQLVATRRSFRTQAKNRSKINRQLVVPTRYLPGRTREIAIVYKRRRPQKFGEFIKAPAQRMVPFVMVSAGLGGMIYFGGSMLNSVEPPSATAATIPAPAETDYAESEDEPEWYEYSEPKRLVIDGIDVSTDIMSVGLMPDETMEVPPIDEYIAGWYRYSPTPGEVGPSVITGHVDNREGPSVFWRLGELEAGDVVDVEREDGQVVEFEVYKAEQYSQSDFPTAKVYGDTDRPELRLITCGGEYDWRAGRYSDNTVVYLRVKD